MHAGLLSSELSILFSAVLGDSNWHAWTLSSHQSLSFSTSRLQPSTVEELVLIKKGFPEGKIGEVLAFPSGHVLKQFLPPLSPLNTSQDVIGGIRIQLEDLQVIVLSNFSNQAALKALSLLIPLKQKELQTRNAVSRIIENQTSRITSLQEERNALLELRKNDVLNLIEGWKLQHAPMSIFTSPDLVDKIDLKQPNQLIINQLQQALDVLRYLHPGSNVFKLSNEFILPSNTHAPTKNTPLGLPSTRNRAELLLDKYELAAQKSLESGQTVTGKAIALFLQPSVSPPAITDALKKNRKSIRLLLDQFPDKWPLLRQYLRPIKEMSSFRHYL